MFFNSDGLNFGQNNHKKIEWVYLGASISG